MGSIGLDAPGVSLAAALASSKRALAFPRGKVPITNRLHAANSRVSNSEDLSAGTSVQQMGRLTLTVTADAFDLQAVFGNYYYGLAGANPITVTFALEVVTPGGTAVSYVATFNNGSLSATMAADAQATTDIIPIKVSKGDTIYARTFVSVTATPLKWPTSVQHANQEYAGDALTTDGDLTASTGLTGFTGSPPQTGYYAVGFAPLAIIGTLIAPSTPVLGFEGDSITTGLGDSAMDALHGWAERGNNNTYPFFNTSRHTESAAMLNPADSRFTPVAYRHKARFTPAATHAICAMGVNDTGDTLAVMKANMIAQWVEQSVLRGAKVWTYTFPPRTTSTDGWITTANQTVFSTEPNRLAINAWVRDGAPILAGVGAATGSNTTGTVRFGATGHPAKGYIETADAWESARDSGFWKTPTKTATVTTTAASKIVNATGAGWTQASELGQQIAIPGAGTSGGVYVGTIFQVVTSNQVYVSGNPATAGTFTAYWITTIDGTHPAKNGHTAAGAALAAQLPAIVSS